MIPGRWGWIDTPTRTRMQNVKKSSIYNRFD